MTPKPVREPVHIIQPDRWWSGLIAMTCLMLILIVRLIHVQLIEGSLWARKAAENRLYDSQTVPGRGVVFDRYGDPLILNEPEYYELLDVKTLFGPTKLLTTDKGLQLLATESARVRQQFHRLYPLGPVLAHVIGYVTPVTAEDLAANRDLVAFDLTGKQGLEQAFDRQLRGAPGEEQYEISALGLKRRLVEQTVGGPGAPLHTTLDPFLSAVSYQALGDNKGAVVMVDSATGELLSMVSTPSFDPNLLTARLADQASESARRSAVSQLFQDNRQLFFNRALSGTYPPGSVFKLVTALAALQSGKVTADTEVIDEGVLRVGDFSYANWYYTQNGGTEGAISLRRAIARSNDIYFYKAAEAAGPDLIASIARSIGFGSPTGLELRGEQAGLVPDPRWKELTRGERWYLGNTYHYGIGQGDLLVTPVQVAQLMQAVSHQGTKCPVHLVKSDVRNCENLGLNEADLELILQGMVDACSVGGTSYPFFAWNTQHPSDAQRASERIDHGQVACKTGTAEFGGTDEKGYKKTHGWFVITVGLQEQLRTATILGESTRATLSASLTATGAADQAKLSTTTQQYLDRQRWLEKVDRNGFPERIAIVVLVESDEQRPYREGSRDAAPIAKAIVDWMVGK